MPSGIEDPRERAEPLDRQQAGEGTIDPGLTAEAPLEFEADEFGLEPPPDFAPLEALPGDGPETSFGGEATSEAEAAEDPAGADREELQQALGNPAGDDGDEAAAASTPLSEPVAAEEPAGTAAQVSGDAPGSDSGVAPESEPGVPGESGGDQAADNVASSEMVGVLEQPEEDALQAAGEEFPPARDEPAEAPSLDELAQAYEPDEPAEPAWDSAAAASEQASEKPGVDELDLPLGAAAHGEPGTSDAEIAVEDEELEQLLEEPPEDKSEVSHAATSAGEAGSSPDQAVDVEAPAAEISTARPLESKEAVVDGSKLADLPPAPATAEETDPPEVVSTRSLEALIREIDEKVALLPGEEALESDRESDSPGVGEQYVSFTLAGSPYALPITQVSEIERVPRITWAPNLPDFVLGVTNMRGDVMAVLDLSEFLGFGPSEPSEQRRIIVVSVGSEALTGAFIVDRVHGLSVVNTDRILKPSGPVDDAITPLLRGLYEDGDRLLQLLDMEEMFRSTKMQQLVAR